MDTEELEQDVDEGSVFTEGQVQESANDELSSSHISRIPTPKGLPRKGILKRSTSFTPKRKPSDSDAVARSAAGSNDNEDNDTVAPLRNDEVPLGRTTRSHSTGERQRKSSDTPSRIPKLVTWWETNSVCSEPPPSTIQRSGREGSSESSADDVSSVGSTPSSIAGTWWFGRSTKYVTHCDRRHVHGDDTSSYLTPTQRKNRELVDMRKQLRAALSQLDDKERHLGQLRERLTELENLMDGKSSFSDAYQLMSRHTQQMESVEAEKKRLIDKYERTIRQLRREKIEETRQTLSRHQQQLEQQRRDSWTSDVGIETSLTSSVNSSAGPDEQLPRLCDTATMTADGEQLQPPPSIATEDGGGDAVELRQQLQVYQYECMCLRSRVSELEYTLGRYEQEIDSEECCPSRACQAKLQEHLAQVQAYKNECLVWRTKAAELEIAFKSGLTQAELVQLLPSGAVDIEAQLEHYKDECLRLTSELHQVKNHQQPHQNGCDPALLNDSGIASNEDYTMGTTGGECSNESCVQMRRLTDETLQHLEMANADKEGMATRLGDLQSQFANHEQQMAQLQRKLDDTKLQLDSIKGEISHKTAEADAAQLGLQRITAENVKMKDYMEKLEEKCHVLQNTVLDAGMVVQGPALQNMVRHCVEPGHQVCKSRTAQTDLTSQALNHNEKEFTDLSSKFDDLQSHIQTEKTDWLDRFRELEESLTLKTNVVQTLTERIQVMQKENEDARELYDKERSEFMKRMEEISEVATQVPLLETRLQQSEDELLTCQKELAAQKLKFQDAIECSVNNGLQNQWETVEYYKRKVAQSIEDASKSEQAKEKANKDLSQTKIRLNLDKSELEQKLEEAYMRMGDLNERVYKKMLDKECTAYPDYESKYVTCRPLNTNKATTIIKGDLFDETEECLKLLKGELGMTQRQVEVLQEKLVDEKDEAAENLVRRASDIECGALRKELMALRAEHAVEKENLERKLAKAEEDRANRSRAERERIKRIESEFDNVKTELDEVIKKYEAEKLRLRERLTELESAARERDALRRRFEQMRRADDARPVPLEILAQKAERLDAEAAHTIFKQNLLSAYGKFDVSASSGDEGTSDDAVSSHAMADSSTQISSVRLSEKSPAVQFLLNKLRAERERNQVESDALRTKLRDLAAEMDRIGAKQPPLAKQENGEKTSQGVREPYTDPFDPMASRARSEPHPPAIVRSVDETSEDSAQLRAKNLCLIKENQRLMSNFEDLKSAVGSMLERHDSLKYPDSSVSEAAFAARMATSVSSQVSISNYSTAADQASTAPTTPVPTTVFSDLASDLNEVRNDLEGIINQIDTATAASSRATSIRSDLHTLASKEGRLMKWLENELKKETEDMDVMAKWYESDKRKLDAEVKELKDTRRTVQYQLDRLALDHHDVCRELELYKQEDMSRAKSRIAIGGGGLLARCASYTDIMGERTENARWKWKAGAMFRELIRLRRENKEQTEHITATTHELIMLRGEMQYVRAERETDIENLLDFPASKTDLGHERATAAAQIAVLNEKVATKTESERRLTTERDELREQLATTTTALQLAKADNTDRENQLFRLQEELKTMRDATESLEVELTTLGQKLAKTVKDKEGRKIVATWAQRFGAFKEQLRSREKLIDSVCSQPDPEWYAQQPSSQQPLSSAGSLSKPTGVISIHEAAEIYEEQQQATTSDVFEKGEVVPSRPGHFVIGRSFPTPIGQYRTSFSDIGEADSVASALSLSTRTATDGYATPLADSLSHISGPPTRSDSFASAVSRSSLLDRLSLTKRKRTARRCASASPSPPIEPPAATTPTDIPQETTWLRTELAMVNQQLRICCEESDKSITQLTHDKQQLEANVRELAAGSNAELQTALEEKRQLEERMDEMRAEMEQKEREQQDMFLIMFRKGQDAARAEIEAEQYDRRSQSSVQSDYMNLYTQTVRAKSEGFQGSQGCLTEEEAMLRFLRDATYYFLMNRDAKDHLQAIMSILKFTNRQKTDVYKVRGSAPKH